MNIIQLVLMPTGTYDPMVLRPYEVADSVRGLARLKAATRDGQNLAPETISGVGGSILRPSTQHLGVVDIENGWGNRRCQFIMVVENQDLDGTIREQRLTGFTDYDGVNLNTGSIDPRMRFFVNNSITMRNVRVMNALGAGFGAGIAKADQVFIKPGAVGTTNFANAEHLQRPKDVFTTLQSLEYLRDADSTLDPRAGFSMENVKLSRRQNTVAPKYLSSLLMAGASSFLNSDFTDSQSKTWASAEGLAEESNYANDPALTNLYRKTSFAEGSSFTFGDLLSICPHLDSVTQIARPQDMTRSADNGPTMPQYRQGTFDGWNGHNHETVWATVLSSSIPTLMMDCMLANVGFRAHNHTFTNETVVDFYYAQPFGKNLDSIALTENFRYRLIMFALRDLLGDNPATFDIQGHFDILGESSMSISIEGQPAVPFATPTFADALFSPILTHGQNRVREIASHMGFFTENLINSDMQPAGQQKQIITNLSSFSGHQPAPAANSHLAAPVGGGQPLSWLHR